MGRRFESDRRSQFSESPGRLRRPLFVSPNRKLQKVEPFSFHGVILVRARVLRRLFVDDIADRRPESLRWLRVSPQPDGSTCGPTCLHAVYRYWNDPIPLEDVIAEVHPLSTGGTLAGFLANHALRRGYRATLYTYNLQLFDPSWFDKESSVRILAKLTEQVAAKGDDRLEEGTKAFQEFLTLGGDLRFEVLTPQLIRSHLNRGVPILTGLSATYLYGCAREFREEYDDVRGEPVGHFVVLSGYDKQRREVRVADPLHNNPRFQSPYYRVSIHRLVSAILLGIVTSDANLLVIEPSRRRQSSRHVRTHRR